MTVTATYVGRWNRARWNTRRWNTVGYTSTPDTVQAQTTSTHLVAQPGGTTQPSQATSTHLQQER